MQSAVLCHDSSVKVVDSPLEVRWSRFVDIAQVSQAGMRGGVANSSRHVGLCLEFVLALHFQRSFCTIHRSEGTRTGSFENPDQGWHQLFVLYKHVIPYFPFLRRSPSGNFRSIEFEKAFVSDALTFGPFSSSLSTLEMFLTSSWRNLFSLHCSKSRRPGNIMRTWPQLLKGKKNTWNDSGQVVALFHARPRTDWTHGSHALRRLENRLRVRVRRSSEVFVLQLRGRERVQKPVRAQRSDAGNQASWLPE